MLSWLRRWWAERARRAEMAEMADRESESEGEGEGEGEREDEDEGESESDSEAAAEGAALADELDLHTFLPRECADVVEEYVRAAQEAGLATVRIIHGKGKGTLRRTVHAVLDRHPAVERYRLAEASRGSWGATLVELKPRPGPPAEAGARPGPEDP